MKKEDRKKFWNRNKYSIFILSLIVIGAGISYTRVYVTNQLLIDPSTNSTVTTDFGHYQIHNGEHFYVSNFTTLDADDEITFGLKILDKMLHMSFVVYGTSQTEIYVYEDSDFTGGTTAYPFNNNRNSTIVCQTNITSNPTINDYGTEIFRESRGLSVSNPQATGTSGLIQRDNEIILNSNTNYLFRIVSRDDDNVVSYIGEWYNGYENE